MKVLSVDGGDGNCVAPSEAAVQDGSYQPLSRPLFIYVSTKALEEKPTVRQFVDFYLDEGAALAAEVEYTAPSGGGVREGRGARGLRARPAPSSAACPRSA